MWQRVYTQSSTTIAMWLIFCCSLAIALCDLLQTMSLCSVCGGDLSVRSGGICITCRTSGDHVLQDSRKAVLGHCPNCGGRLRGKGRGYCPSRSKGHCSPWTQRDLKVTEAVADPVDEKLAAAAATRPPRALRRHSMEVSSMSSENAFVQRWRLEYIDVHVRERRLMGLCGFPSV